LLLWRLPRLEIVTVGGQPSESLRSATRRRFSFALKHLTKAPAQRLIRA